MFLLDRNHGLKGDLNGPNPNIGPELEETRFPKFPASKDMAWRSGSSLSRSLISTARASTFRSSPSISSLPRAPLRNLIGSSSRRNLFSLPVNAGQLACAQSLMPLHSALASARLTSHISVEARHCCELSQGTSIDPS
ncbi:hypothetical protein ACFX13_028059 [Malus domestica]